MYTTNDQLSNFINTILNRRIKLNLRLECLDDITLKVSRRELREYTGARRIEDATIEKMIEGLKGFGYEVTGHSNSSAFVITFKVRDYLTKFTDLESLVEANSWIEDIFKVDTKKVATTA